jgi:hypothetical protein
VSGPCARALVRCNDYSTMVWRLRSVCPASRVVHDSHELCADRIGTSESRAWLLVAEALLVRIAHQCIVTSPGHR